MDRISKNFALILIIITATSSLSLLMIKPAFAQTIPTPSVPKFTLKFVDNSYDLPTTSSIDPYTGKTVTTQSGYHVENKSIEVIIIDQPWIRPNDNESIDNQLTLVYNITAKGHYANDWTYYSFQSKQGHYGGVSSGSFVTVATFGLGENNGSDVYSYTLPNITAGGQVDFQVQASIGTTVLQYNPQVTPNPYSYYYVWMGESSGWSNTQTLTIPESSISTSSPTPAIPEFPTLIILPLFILILSIPVIVRLGKTWRII